MRIATTHDLAPGSARRRGIQAGGGSTGGLQYVRLLALGGSLLLAAAIGVLFRRRLAHGAARPPR